jgi:DNA-directed RNA polymerase subunit RPC12/RpoP
MSEIRYFKVECGKCGQRIEGDMEGFERLIQCPTCSAYVMARPCEPETASLASLKSLSPIPFPPAIQQAAAEGEATPPGALPLDVRGSSLASLVERVNNGGSSGKRVGDFGAFETVFTR